MKGQLSKGKDPLASLVKIIDDGADREEGAFIWASFDGLGKLDAHFFKPSLHLLVDFCVQRISLFSVLLEVFSKELRSRSHVLGYPSRG